MLFRITFFFTNFVNHYSRKPFLANCGFTQYFGKLLSQTIFFGNHHCETFFFFANCRSSTVPDRCSALRWSSWSGRRGGQCCPGRLGGPCGSGGLQVVMLVQVVRVASMIKEMLFPFQITWPKREKVKNFSFRKISPDHSWYQTNIPLMFFYIDFSKMVEKYVSIKRCLCIWQPPRCAGCQHCL